MHSPSDWSVQKFGVWDPAREFCVLVQFQSYGLVLHHPERFPCDLNVIGFRRPFGVPQIEISAVLSECRVDPVCQGLDGSFGVDSLSVRLGLLTLCEMKTVRGRIGTGLVELQEVRGGQGLVRIVP